MIFDKQGAIEAFQLFLKDIIVISSNRPKVIDVRVTRSGKFIVSVAHQEVARPKASPEHIPSKDKVVGSSPTGDAINNPTLLKGEV